MIIFDLTLILKFSKMKFIVSILCIVSVFTFSSCKKEYVCNCTQNDQGGGSDLHFGYIVQAINKTKGQDACNTFAASHSSGGINTYCNTQ